MYCAENNVLIESWEPEIRDVDTVLELTYFLT